MLFNNPSPQAPEQNEKFKVTGVRLHHEHVEVDILCTLGAAHINLTKSLAFESVKLPRVRDPFDDSQNIPSDLARELRQQMKKYRQIAPPSSQPSRRSTPS